MKVKRVIIPAVYGHFASLTLHSRIRNEPKLVRLVFLFTYLLIYVQSVFAARCYAMPSRVVCLSVCVCPLLG